MFFFVRQKVRVIKQWFQSKGQKSRSITITQQFSRQHPARIPIQRHNFSDLSHMPPNHIFPILNCASLKEFFLKHQTKIAHHQLCNEKKLVFAKKREPRTRKCVSEHNYNAKCEYNNLCRCTHIMLFDRENLKSYYMHTLWRE